jgi:C1A family cysteine protease
LACRRAARRPTTSHDSTTNPKRSATAPLIRNSWGTGYGWLPYEYVRRGLAEDWWALLHADWTDLGVFAA